MWLTTLGLQKFTNEEALMLAAEMSDKGKFMIVEAWKHLDFIYKTYILSALENDLYNDYSTMKSSKELWDALVKKFKTEDVCVKKFVIAKILDYKMLDKCWMTSAGTSTYFP